jgi:extradiol dioxygenase family protein
MNPFHLAFRVSDLEKTRHFYKTYLGCEEGRSAPTWVDFDFYGHQISAHLLPLGDEADNPVDGKAIPIPHFGLILAWDQFHELAERLKQADMVWIHEPMVRFQGQVGEQATMFLRDPSGNALEFKAFKNQKMIFAKA